MSHSRAREDKVVRPCCSPVCSIWWRELPSQLGTKLGAAVEKIWSVDRSEQESASIREHVTRNKRQRYLPWDNQHRSTIEPDYKRTLVLENKSSKVTFLLEHEFMSEANKISKGEA